MANRLFISKLIGLLFITMLTFTSCIKDDIVEKPPVKTVEEEINQMLYTYLKEIYLWNDQVSGANLNYNQNPAEFFYSRLVEQDQWSFIMNITTFNDIFIKGQYAGHGISFEADENNEMRVSLVYKQTNMYNYGIRRGFIIDSINGQRPTVDNIYELLGSETPGVTNRFVFRKNDGSKINLTATKEIVQANTVLYRDTIQMDQKVAGYLVFNSFTGTAIEELLEAFDYFKANNVQELILDLRYNGGGDTNIADTLAGLIVGEKYAGQEYIKFTHNKLYSSWNLSNKIPLLANALNLSRLYVITTDGTASASESVINGLEPFIPVYLIGSRTHGKPVGMYTFQEPKYDLLIAPICFRLININNEGDYFSGLPVDKEVKDDLSREFGDKAELCLSEAMYHIQNGSFKPTMKSHAPIFTKKIKRLREKQLFRTF